MTVDVETERLRLRELAAEDYPEVIAYASDPAVYRYVPYGPHAPEAIRKELDQMIAAQSGSPRKLYALAMVPKELGRAIGVVTLSITNVKQGEAALGYLLQKAHWGRGYATEACRGAMRLGFETLGLHRIWATVSVDNLASVRVVEKLGMRREGRLVEHMNIQGVWMDSLVFAMLRREADVAWGQWGRSASAREPASPSAYESEPPPY